MYNKLKLKLYTFKLKQFLNINLL